MRHHPLAYQSHRTLACLTLLALSAGLLGGCETNGGPSNPVSELVAYSSGAQASAPAAAQQTDKPKSRAQVAMDCWAAAEKSRASASLDARADFVNDCIEKGMKSSDASAAVKPESKPAASAKPKPRAEAKPAS